MYCQVKDITRLGDRTCHKCNSEIMENYLRYTESTACSIQVSLQLLDGCFMNRRLNPIPVAKMRGCACPRAQPIFRSPDPLPALLAVLSFESSCFKS
jgi:hypothetical protein